MLLLLLLLLLLLSKWWGRAFEAHHECTRSRKHAWLAFNNFGLPLNLIIIIISLRTLIPVES